MINFAIFALFLLILGYMIYRTITDKPVWETLYYTIMNEIVASTPEVMIIKKLNQKYKLPEGQAQLLLEIVKIGDKDWFRDTYNSKKVK
jgi:hypothetical protein